MRTPWPFCNDCAEINQLACQVDLTQRDAACPSRAKTPFLGEFGSSLDMVFGWIDQQKIGPPSSGADPFSDANPFYPSPRPPATSALALYRLLPRVESMLRSSDPPEREAALEFVRFHGDMVQNARVLALISGEVATYRPSYLEPALTAEGFLHGLL